MVLCAVASSVSQVDIKELNLVLFSVTNYCFGKIFAFVK
jgi:hypothetical protein